MSFAVLHFTVSQLWIRPELLGTSHRLPWNGRAVSLRFPLQELEFGGEYDPHERAFHRWGPPEDEIVQVATVQLVVEVHEDIPAATAEHEVTPEHPRFKVGVRLLGEAIKAGQSFLTAYLDKVRSSHGQPWLGLNGHPPETTHTNRIYDQRGEVVPAGILSSTLKGKDSGACLTIASHRVLITDLAAGARPAIGEALLSDALYLLGYSEEPQLRQAVLLGAIACEVQIKQTLILAASASQLALVETLFENPRDFSVAASSLFDKVAKAVIGRSLREEDKTLFAAVSDLFTTRNRIAHRGGADLTDERMRDAVIAARDGFRWAQRLRSDSDDDSIYKLPSEE